MLPLDNRIWGVFEAKACTVHHQNITDLKAAMEQWWANMTLEFMAKTCKKFRPEIEVMIKAGGDHIEE